jgi:hypothetical protein
MRARPLVVHGVRALAALAMGACSKSSDQAAATAPQTPPSSAAVYIDASHAGATIASTVLGANFAVWTDITQTSMPGQVAAAGMTATRWPGGSTSDTYHWSTNSACAGTYTQPNDTFDTFMHDIVLAAHLDVSITLNYGSNAACNGGGDPSEAAAWVSYANVQKGYGVHWWTVGNEVYDSSEYDLHPVPHDPATYGTAVDTGYYPRIKAVDPTAMVGIVVTGHYTQWDSTVFARTSHFDFVEFHYYAQNPGQESDAYLLTQAPDSLAHALGVLRAEMTHFGVPSAIPIYVGELGSVKETAGKQTMSIVQGLFAGMAIAELMKAGVTRATWWLAYGGCTLNGGNMSSSIYGWQDFSGYMIFSDGIPVSWECVGAPTIPEGTPLPTARAYQLMSLFGHNGEHILPTTVATGYADVRAYGATQGTGYAVLLLNLSETDTTTVSVGVSTLGSGSHVSVTTYGKVQYDDSRNNVWTGPVAGSLGAYKSTVAIALPPWSMSVAQITP